MNRGRNRVKYPISPPFLRRQGRCPIADTNAISYAWTQEQARRLRDAAGGRSNLDIDWDNVAEEIESLGRSDRRELRSRLTVMSLEMRVLDEGFIPALPEG